MSTDTDTVRLPPELMELARAAEGQREVTVPPEVLLKIDAPFAAGLSASLRETRRRSFGSAESLSIVVR